MAAIAGASFPDLDLIWFYLIDDRQFHHHHYWVHAPAFALLVSAALLLLSRVHPVALAFAAGWMVHILLDAPVGGIMWLWPVSDELFVLYEVPATQTHWLLSFVLHWSFLPELAIWGAAIALLLRAGR